MKRILFPALFLQVFYCGAQNYQCLQTGVKNYFINSTGYLRGIRIDSTVTTGAGTIFYPFHSFRLIDSPSAHGSWLGSKVLMEADGTFLFDNIWHDTVVIKSQANIGDSWLFYNDTTSKYYKATVLSIDTMAISGTFDSVKTIRIKAYTSGVEDTMDLNNNMELKISKNHGFAQAFDLYTFPYRFGIVPDYFFQQVHSQVFSRIDFHNPSFIELYNFSPGDLYEHWESSVLAWPYLMANPLNIDYEGFIMDSIVARISIDPYHLQYIVQHKGYQNEMDYTPVSLTATYHNSYNFTDTFTVDTTRIFPVLTMPEEYPDLTLYYLKLSDTSLCVHDTVYSLSEPAGVLANPAGLTTNSTECANLLTYKTGFGCISSQSILCDQDPPTETVNNDLIYTMRNGVSCGNYHALEVAQTEKPVNSISLYPDPATTLLHITSAIKVTGVTICNLSGQVVQNGLYDNKSIEINTSALAPGIYLVRINGTETRKFVKE